MSKSLRRQLKNIFLNFKIKCLHSKKIKNDNPKTFLFWVPGGYIGLLNIESIVGLALLLRGHKVHYIICDGFYKACARRHDFPDIPYEQWKNSCFECKRINSKFLDKMRLDYSFVGDYVQPSLEKHLREQAENIKIDNFIDLTFQGVNIGKNLFSGLVRHYRGGDFYNNEIIFKEFAFTVLTVATAMQNAIKKFNPSKVFMSHGIYADWGPALAVSLSNNIPVTTYSSCYLPGRFFFKNINSANDITAQSINDETWSNYLKMELTSKENRKLDEFLNNRYKKFISGDMKGLLKKYVGDNEIFYEKYNLDKNKPVWGLMTHINWDNVKDYFPMIHDNFDDWVYKSVQEMINVKDVQWLIKIHPSEKNDNPKTGSQALIEKSFPTLPSHIKIIRMDDDISALDFYNLIDGGITVFGTAGLELALMGKPVILAGSAHYGEKGFTYDAKDQEHYSQLLKQAFSITSLNENQINLARKYAYCFFIQRQIPNAVLDDNWQIKFKKINSLLPKKDSFIDFICDCIVNEKEFIMDDSLMSKLNC